MTHAMKTTDASENSASFLGTIVAWDFGVQSDATSVKIRREYIRDILEACNNVRDSTWDKRKAECSSLMVKAESFANLLGDKLQRLREQLNELTLKFGDAQSQARKTKSKAIDSFSRIGLAPKNATQTPERANKALMAFDRIG